VTRRPVRALLINIRPGDGRIGELLAGCALFVLPSRLDQWPNAVMEAMSYGVPPVVSDIGGMPEMVLDGQAVRDAALVRERGGPAPS
jgi:glycosyltransferase involved in cell wall biosynthesis